MGGAAIGDDTDPRAAKSQAWQTSHHDWFLMPRNVDELGFRDERERIPGQQPPVDRFRERIQKRSPNFGQAEVPALLPWRGARLNRVRKASAYMVGHTVAEHHEIVDDRCGSRTMCHQARFPQRGVPHPGA